MCEWRQTSSRLRVQTRQYLLQGWLLHRMRLRLRSTSDLSAQYRTQLHFFLADSLRDHSNVWQFSAALQVRLLKLTHAPAPHSSILRVGNRKWTCSVIRRCRSEAHRAAQVIPPIATDFAGVTAYLGFESNTITNAEVFDIRLNRSDHACGIVAEDDRGLTKYGQMQPYYR
jgi:hypothetical protein